jgi:ligand-binding sensor domain-containing protein
VVRNITIDQGLSDTHLVAIVQDGDGFLWFGTADGLNRYDGYEIRVFDHEPENPRSLGSSFVQALHVDRAGTLWVGTLGGGLSRYDPLREDFVRFQHDPEDPESLAGDEVFSICSDRTSALWLATSNGLDRMDPSSGRFRHFRHEPEDPMSVSSDGVYSVIEDRGGSIWIGTGLGLDHMVLTDGNGRFTHYRHDAGDPKRPS